MSERSPWRRSSRCSSGGCAEVSTSPAGAYIRDSTDPDGPALAFAVQPWQDFIAAIKNGELDRR